MPKIVKKDCFGHFLSLYRVYARQLFSPFMKKVVYKLRVLCYNNHVSDNMKHYPTHEEIADQILKLVESNLACPHTHNRENLDDIIADLQQYMESIPSIQDYIDHNLL